MRAWLKRFVRYVAPSRYTPKPSPLVAREQELLKRKHRELAAHLKAIEAELSVKARRENP